MSAQAMAGSQQGGGSGRKERGPGKWTAAAPSAEFLASLRPVTPGSGAKQPPVVLGPVVPPLPAVPFALPGPPAGLPPPQANGHAPPLQPPAGPASNKSAAQLLRARMLAGTKREAAPDAAGEPDSLASKRPRVAPDSEQQIGSSSAAGAASEAEAASDAAAAASDAAAAAEPESAPLAEMSEVALAAEGGGQGPAEAAVAVKADVEEAEGMDIAAAPAAAGAEGMDTAAPAAEEEGGGEVVKADSAAAFWAELEGADAKVRQSPILACCGSNARSNARTVMHISPRIVFAFPGSMRWAAVCM
jgi:hypothetical protein